MFLYNIVFIVGISLLVLVGFYSNDTCRKQICEGKKQICEGNLCLGMHL